MAQDVLLDEAVRGLHDLGAGAEILLHQQHPGPGMLLLEGEQGLGVGRPEAVDALILVPHHEQVVPAPGQPTDDCMLDSGGVLGLVHTDIRKPSPEIFQGLRAPRQDIARVEHLVVIVHQAPGPQLLPIEPVNLRDAPVTVLLQLFDFRLVQHAVLDIGNQCPDSL